MIYYNCSKERNKKGEKKMDKIFVELSQEQLVSIGIALSRTWADYCKYDLELMEEHENGKVMEITYKAKHKYYCDTLKELQDLADIMVQAQIAAQKGWKKF